eukprot:scaffold74877_cov30-Prasinocladus_malaysianus.AAC.1
MIALARWVASIDPAKPPGPPRPAPERYRAVGRRSNARRNGFHRRRVSSAEPKQSLVSRRGRSTAVIPVVAIIERHRNGLVSVFRSGWHDNAESGMGILVHINGRASEVRQAIKCRNAPHGPAGFAVPVSLVASLCPLKLRQM